MASIDPGAPTVCDLTRVRGDTFQIRFQIKDELKQPINIDSFTFRLTVDPSPDPVDAGSNLFTIVGVIIGATTDGTFGFTPLAVDADQLPDTYFYDVEMTDAGGGIRTIIIGEWIVPQDISK